MDTSGPRYTNAYQEFENFRGRIKREQDILEFTQLIYQEEDKRSERWNEDDGWSAYVVQSELNPDNALRMAAAKAVERAGIFEAGGNRVGVEYNENSGELYITFRGSQNYADWAHDLAFTKDGKKNDPRYGGHQATIGASEAFESLWNAGDTEEESPIAISQEIGDFGQTSLKEILDSFHGVGVTHVNVSGHSLGGAMATLMLERTGDDGNNYLQEWMQEEGLTSSDMTAITYGAPQAFIKGKDTNEWHVPPVFHAYVNMGDPVPEIGRFAKSMKDNAPDYYVHYGNSEYGGKDTNLVYFGDSWVAAGYQATKNKDLMHFMSWYDINVSDAMVNESLGQYQNGVSHFGDPKHTLDKIVEIIGEYGIRVLAKPIVEAGMVNLTKTVMEYTGAAPWMAEIKRAQKVMKIGDQIHTTLKSLSRGPLSVGKILKMEKLHRQVTKAFNQLTVFKTNIGRLGAEFGGKAQELGMSGINQMKALMESARDLEGITKWIDTAVSGIETKLQSSMRYWRGEAEAAEQGFGLSDVLFSETTPLEQVPVEIMNANPENALNADIITADAEISLNNPEVYNQFADAADIETILNETLQRATETAGTIGGTVKGEELDVSGAPHEGKTVKFSRQEPNLEGMSVEELRTKLAEGQAREARLFEEAGGAQGEMERAAAKAYGQSLSDAVAKQYGHPLSRPQKGEIYRGGGPEPEPHVGKTVKFSRQEPNLEDMSVEELRTKLAEGQAREARLFEEAGGAQGEMERAAAKAYGESLSDVVVQNSLSRAKWLGSGERQRLFGAQDELMEIEESMARQSQATAQLARARTMEERMQFTEELSRAETVYGVPDLSLNELQDVLGMNEETRVGFEEALDTAGIEEGVSALDVMASDSFTWNMEEEGYVAGEDLDVSAPTEGEGALGDVEQIQSDVGQELHGTDEINTETDAFEFGLDEGMTLEEQFASRPGWDHPEPTEATEGLTLEETIARNRSNWFIEEFESRGLTFEAAEAVVDGGIAERLVGMGLTGEQATGVVNAARSAAARAGVNLKDFLGEAAGMAALTVIFAGFEDAFTNPSEDPLNHLENIGKITVTMATSMAQQMAEGAILMDDDGNFGSADAFENAAVFYGLVVGPKVMPMMMGESMAAAMAGGPMIAVMAAIMGSILVYEEFKERNKMAQEQQEAIQSYYNETGASGNTDGLNLLCMQLYGSTIKNLPDSMKDDQHLAASGDAWYDQTVTVDFSFMHGLTVGTYDGPVMTDNWLMDVPGRLYAQASVQADIQKFAIANPDQKGIPWWLSPSISPSAPIPGTDPPEYEPIKDWSTNNIDQWCLIDTTGMGIMKEDYIQMQFGIWNTIISPPGEGENSQANFFSGYGGFSDNNDGQGESALVISGILHEGNVADPTTPLDMQNNHLHAIKEEYLDWALSDDNSKFSSWQFIGSMAAAYRQDREARADMALQGGLFSGLDASEIPDVEGEQQEEEEDDSAAMGRFLSETNVDEGVGIGTQGYDFVQWLKEDVDGRQRYATYDIKFSDQMNGGYDMITNISDENPEGLSMRESLYETAMSGAIATGFTVDVFTGMLKTVLDQMFYGQQGMEYDFGDDTNVNELGGERATGLSDLAKGVLPDDFQIFIRVLEMAARAMSGPFHSEWADNNLDDLYMKIYLEGDNAVAGLDLPETVLKTLKDEVFDLDVDMWLGNPGWNIDGLERENPGGFQYTIRTGMISHQSVLSMVHMLDVQGYGAAEDQLSALESAFHDARAEEGIDTFSAGSWLGTYMHQHPEAWADYDATSDNPSSAMQQAWEDSFTNVTITDAGANGTEVHDDYHNDPFTIQIGEITEMDELQNWILNNDGSWSHKPEDTPHHTRHVGGRAQQALNEDHGPIPQTVARAATHAMQVWELEGFRRDPVKLLIDSVKRRRLNDPGSSALMLQSAL